MNYLIRPILSGILFISIALLPNIWSREIVFSDKDIFDDLIDKQVDEVMLTLKGNITLQEIRDLRMAKISIVNGNLKEARYYLMKINENQSQLGVVKLRYLAIVNFIEGNYEDSINHLSKVNALRPMEYKQTCELLLLSLMAQEDSKGVKANYAKCSNELFDSSTNDLFWLTNMFYLYQKDFKQLNSELIYASNRILKIEDTIRLWLKFNLFLGRNKNSLDIVSTLPESAYESFQTRELIALMYLRQKDYTNALSFIEDINSVNAENIKGSIRVIEKAYELAFGHFKLALQKKPDSINALEKSIPLSWLLGQWEDGRSMLTNVTDANLQDSRSKNALDTAFLLRLKKFKESKRNLLFLRNDFQNKPPSEILMMETYQALSESNSNDLEDRSEESCKSFDGMSCYIALQTMHWNNLGNQIKEDYPILQSPEYDVNQYKINSPVTPIKEQILIDQRDIEELDSLDVFKNEF